MTVVTCQILLIDDCPEDLETYRRYLLRDRQHTYNILKAETGEEALLLCQQQFPDAIVMDYLLPDMDGLELLNEFQAQFGKSCPPVIMVTGQGNEQLAVQAMKSGAVDYLIKKNITRLNFTKTVENVLEKKRLTKQLSSSEARLLATFNQAAVGIAHVGLDGKWLLVNQKLCDIVGYPRSELLTLTFQDITHPDDGNIGFEYIVQMLNGEIHNYSQELRYICKDNTQVWINLNLSLVSKVSGSPEYFICVLQDITQQKQAEAALQKSEAKYRTLFNSIDEGFILCDVIFDSSDRPVDIFYVEANTAATQMTGQKLTGRFTSENGSNFESDLFEIFGRVARTGEPVRIELPATPLNAWYEFYVFRPDDANDQRVAAIYTNISDRKQAQEKIRSQAALLDVATDAIFVCDLENRILFWNKGAENLYGWTAEESLGKEANKIFYQETLSSPETGLETTISDGSWQGELKQITKTGKTIIVASRWTLVRDESGKPQSILVVNTNITEKKQLEQQFYQTQRLKSLGTLASGIAHDLNNILTPILGAAQLLPLKLPDLDCENKRLLKILSDSSIRGVELVKQITAFARGGEGKHVPLQLKHLLKEIEQVVKSTFPKSIETSICITNPNLWAVSADPTQIHQVLMNLCVNARDAMPDGGKLIISAENFHVDRNYARMNLEAKVGDYVVITVSDTGCGMSQEVKQRIFEPFFTTKETEKGTGLGLSTVIGIIKNHGGFVHVHSEVGKGSQFQVFLRAIKASITQEADNDRMVLGNGELILVVDDEAFVREIAKTSLEELSYRVLIASDGIEALSLYAQHKNQISVVLMDIQMPKIDGLKAIRVLQQMNPNVKIIAISGLKSNQKLLEANQINVQAFLLKPYTIGELLGTIKSVLASKSQ